MLWPKVRLGFNGGVLLEEMWRYFWHALLWCILVYELLLTSLTCESNSLKLDVAFAMLPSALRMANFFLSVSQINDPQAKWTGCKVSSWVRCFPWWRSWLVTIWKVKDELLGPRLHLWYCVKCTWMLWKFFLHFLMASPLKRFDVYPRSTFAQLGVDDSKAWRRRHRRNSLSVRKEKRFDSYIHYMYMLYVYAVRVWSVHFRLGRSSSSTCTLFWSPFWAGHISHGLGLGSRWGGNSKETCMTMMERSSMQPGDAGSLWGGLRGSSCWSASAFKSLGTRLSF